MRSQVGEFGRDYRGRDKLFSPLPLYETYAFSICLIIINRRHIYILLNVPQLESVRIVGDKLWRMSKKLP